LLKPIVIILIGLSSSRKLISYIFRMGKIYIYLLTVLQTVKSELDDN